MRAEVLGWSRVRPMKSKEMEAPLTHGKKVPTSVLLLLSLCIGVFRPVDAFINRVSTSIVRVTQRNTATAIAPRTNHFCDNALKLVGNTILQT
jgi:hypothetical protein